MAAELTAFEQDPRNRLMYGDELQSDATEATMLCGFLNVNGCLNIYLRKNLILLGYLKLTCIGHLFLPWIIGMNECKANGSLFTLPCVIIHRNQSTRRGNQADVYK